jgi:uncharacterized membrane protein SpoIIM required for sporulation
MTEDNISKGDPFGVYKNENPLNMFAYIALNNIYVSFQVFVWGFFIGLGTIYMLFTNGVMVGSFQYYFFAKNLGWQSILVIWTHGTLEISAIILSGAAGLILSNSFLFPSLMHGAKDGLKLMIALVPILLVAAFLEGFVTRYSYYAIPYWITILILAGSLTFIVWYFVWYPIQVQRRTKAEKAVE